MRTLIFSSRTLNTFLGQTSDPSVPGSIITRLNSFFSYMEKLQDEDVEELMRKREAQLILKQEVDEINRQALLQRERRAEQEKIQDLKVKYCSFL